MILVVEDDKLLGRSVSMALKTAGYEVKWATNAEEAFKALVEGEVKLIYLDIMLPGGMDGYEILKRIKRDGSSFVNIPVIMLSNLGQMNEMERAMDLGANDYIIKANIDLANIVELTSKKYEVSP